MNSSQPPVTYVNYIYSTIEKEFSSNSNNSLYYRNSQFLF